MRRALVLTVALIAGGSGPAAANSTTIAPGRPDVWQRAVEAARPAGPEDAYLRALREGDEHVALATPRSASLTVIREQVHRAIESYRAAAAARPAAAEPHFRIAAVLWSFYLQSCEQNVALGATRSPLAECPPEAVNVRIAEQAIAAWEAAEARAPLDPRFGGATGDSAGGLGSILFHRAILQTKLTTRPHLEGAARSYEAILQRADGAGAQSIVQSNLAETYMMLGRLDDAIDAYREAVRGGGDLSAWYGLAVALDRDGRGSLAREIVQSQKLSGYRAFRESVFRGGTFFVPAGEVYYYYALAEEALGRADDAIIYWGRFIASGAHPQYQGRAREHLEALLARKRAGAPAPPPPPLDPLPERWP